MSPFNRPRVLGLALGGGGLRGLAHIGVLKVLESEGVRPGVLAGTSMGGVIAAAYAAGMTPQALAAEVAEFANLRRLLGLIDLAPARRGLLHGDNVRAFLAEKIGSETTFADLAIPLGVVAVDIDTGEEVVLTQGRVLDAVLATCAVPSIFSPVQLGGHLLADGGILNNVPADVARKLGAETVIAVDVESVFPLVGRRRSSSPRQAPSFLPRIAQDLYQAELIMSSKLTEDRLREARPELILRPDIPDGISAFSGFMRGHEAVLAGETAARAHLAEIRRMLRPGRRLFRSGRVPPSASAA